MAPHIQITSRPWRRTWVLLLFLTFGVCSPSTAVAQGEGVYYVPDTTFKIPIQKDPSERGIKQVLLYVSTDYGRTFQQVAAAAPSQDKFQFRANGDGWYWFAVRTQDVQGGLHPASLTDLEPGLKICVDTVNPQVALRAVKLRDWPVGVEWDIRDENPNLLSLQMDYRAKGALAWTPLQAEQLVRGDFGWMPRANETGPLEVRLRVRDKAENEEVVTTTVVPGKGANPGTVPRPSSNPDPIPGEGRVIMVNKRNVNLNFKIDNVGKSDVARVEVWMTRDSRTWQKYDDKVQKHPPYSIELPAEGRYGFTLVAVSGVGLSVARPRPGDLPQVWVELDETKPTVRLTDIVVGRGIDSGKLTLRWVAEDRYLKNQPIRLFYGTTANGPWTPIPGDLPNDGVFVWQMPQGDDMPYQFHVKVDAEDLAGNVGSDTTEQPIAVDLNVPKASIIDVDVKPLK